MEAADRVCGVRVVVFFENQIEVGVTAPCAGAGDFLARRGVEGVRFGFGRMVDDEDGQGKGLSDAGQGAKQGGNFAGAVNVLDVEGNGVVDEKVAFRVEEFGGTDGVVYGAAFGKLGIGQEGIEGVGVLG